MRKIIFAALAASAALAVTTPALAAPTQVAYSGNLGSSANIKAPFNAVGSGFTASMPFSGTFYYDPTAVPASGTTNLFFNTLTGISAAEAFTLDFGPLHFTGADNLDSQTQAAAQFTNGEFSGFNFLTDFTYLGNPYELRISGTTITVKAGANGVITNSTNLIGARINFGNSSLSQVVPTGTGAVPEPATWAMMLLGFGGIGIAMRRKQKAMAPQLT
jgi:hypothetical protein